jgi:hypothetical protein
MLKPYPMSKSCARTGMIQGVSPRIDGQWGIYLANCFVRGRGVFQREKARSPASALTTNTEVLVWREVGAPPKREPILEAPAAPTGATEGAERAL